MQVLRTGSKRENWHREITRLAAAVASLAVLVLIWAIL